MKDTNVNYFMEYNGHRVYVDQYMEGDKVLVGRKQNETSFYIISEKIKNELLIMNRNKILDDILGENNIDPIDKPDTPPDEHEEYDPSISFKTEEQKVIAKWDSLLNERKNKESTNKWGILDHDTISEPQINKVFNNEIYGTSSDTFLLPMSTRIAASTIGLNLIPVKSMGYVDEEKIEEIRNRHSIENREKSIDSIIEGTEFIATKLEDDDGYKEVMGTYIIDASLFDIYIDDE